MAKTRQRAALESGVTDYQAGDTARLVFASVSDSASGAIEATAAALRTDAGIQVELRYQCSDVFSARANISGDVVFLERALLALQGAQSPAAESNP